MRLAVLSDVHGNLAALEAVMADAAAQGAQAYWVLGDYHGECAEPDEVVSLLRQLPNAQVLKGNRETYLDALAGQDPAMWTDHQFAPLYWTYRALAPENRAYLAQLPEQAEDPGLGIHAAHSPVSFFGPPFGLVFNGKEYAEQFAGTGMSHADYVRYTQTRVAGDAALCGAALSQPPGIYLFGHFHTQWYTELEGRLLLNPGACGLPLDGHTDAPYALLDIADGRWTVTLRRVPYDVEAEIGRLEASPLYTAAPGYSSMTVRQLRMGSQVFGVFLRHVTRMAQARCIKERPFPNALWEEALDTWET